MIVKSDAYASAWCSNPPNVQVTKKINEDSTPDVTNDTLGVQDTDEPTTVEPELQETITNTKPIAQNAKINLE